MLLRKIVPIVRAVVALAALAVAGSSFSQAYPTKPIRVINPWAPAGPAEIVARPIMQKLSEALGQPIVIDSRAGANGVIGASIVARSPADGYTLLFSHVGPIAISPAMQTMPYNSVKDFEPITQLVSGPLVLVVRPDLPIKTVPDLIGYAKANPGKLSYGSVGPGSTTHLGGEMIGMLAAVKLVHVPYKGAAPVITDMLGKQIEFAFINISGVLPHMQAGRLRGIAVSTLKRSAVLPDLPTVADTLPGFEVNSWYGMMAPAGTPKPIVARLHAEVIKVLKSPDITERLKQSGLDVEGSSPQEHAAKIRDDLARWSKVVKATGLSVN